MPANPAQLDPHAAAELSALLAGWLPEQRWYGGKGEALAVVTVESARHLHQHVTDDSRVDLWHVITSVYGAGGARQDEGDEPAPGSHGAPLYQLLVGIRDRLPDRLSHAAIGTLSAATADAMTDGAPRASGADGEPAGAVAYDAAHDAQLTHWLLDQFAASASEPAADAGGDRPDEAGAHGTDDAEAGRDAETGIDFRLVDGAELPDARTDPMHLASLVLTGEQSNTSLVFGDALILKLFRRLVPGTNPDLELALALHSAGSRHIPAPVGWIEAALHTERDAAPRTTTLGILQEFLPTATDGWVLAQTSVRDLYADPELTPAEAGGDFAPEAHRLGAATAEVHRDLAATLPTAELHGPALAALAGTMTARFDEAVHAAPPLADFAEPVHAAYRALADLDHPVIAQRVHGDYHLGQVMRTPTAWVLLDFEGEPARPLRERRALSSPLRDVAAMLRSFDYAAHHLLATMAADSGTFPDQLIRERAGEWATRNRAAFCAGYAEVAGTDPNDESVVLRAFEIDKAVYEVMYETRNRPAWVGIPLAAVRRLTS
jgi:maltokinase